MYLWYEDDPQRFEQERGLLKACGFELDSEALRLRRRVEFRGTINDGRGDVRIIIVCPFGFPFQIPWFIAPDLQLNQNTRHITFRSHSICLRLAKPSGWDPNEHIVGLIEDARRVLIGQHTGGFGDEHLAPDRDLFNAHASSATTVLVPSDLLELPPSRVASCKIGAFTPSLFIVQCVGDKRTSERFQLDISDLGSASVFRLRQLPVEFLFAYDDIFKRGEPNVGRMLAEYALDTSAESKAFPRFTAQARNIFGVVFPYQGETPFWQFFQFDWVSGVRKPNPLVTVPTTDLTARITSSLDLSTFSNARIVVVGCGAIGSTVAVELACAGIGELRINDSDRISLGNIVRHEATLFDVGSPKIRSVKERINSKNPRTRVTVGGDIFEDPEFATHIQRASAVVVTVGNEGVERYVNRLCVKYGIPAIYSYVGLHAAIGHVIRTTTENNVTGCFECFLTLYKENDLIPPLPEPEANEVVVELGCNTPALPGAGFDIKTIALTAVRRVIQTLATASYRDDYADITIFTMKRMQGTEDHSLKILRRELPADDRCEICRPPKAH